jgi:two-component system cell cycle sensor histidine kinase/response regulator CckA
MMAKRVPTTILLVDDDPLIRGLGQELLEHLGYRVETAGDGSEALAKYRQMGRADLVVLDYYLPGQTGSEILKEFKILDRKVRVLMASGFFSTQEAASLKREGVLGLINKPFRLTDLEDRIRAALTGRAGS